MGKSKAAKAAQVPECRYAAACTRKDCIFKHPPKKVAAAAPAAEKSDKVCFAFVAGRCAFGKWCHDKHPDEDSCRTIRDRYTKIDCQWGRICRTEGCLYRHPDNEPIGPAMPLVPPKPQPAVFADGPTIAPTNAQGGVARPRAAVPGRIEVLPIPKAIMQAADLRDATAFDISDPLDRFIAVNARNTGTQSAALLDLHFQSAQTFQAVLDDVLPERLRMFQQSGGAWLVTGVSSSQQGAGLFDAVREYLVRHGYQFAIGQDEGGLPSAFHVRGRRKRQDPLEEVRAILICGLPGSGKSMIAEALGRRSCGRFLRICQDMLQGDLAATEAAFQKAAAEANSAADAVKARKKNGCWWWDHAFSGEKYFLALCFRGPALGHLSDCFGFVPGPTESFHATLAYQPTALDLRRLLGRPHRVSFRYHLTLEATFAPHAGETLDVVLGAAHTTDAADAAGGAARGPRPTSVYLAPRVPQWAARHLQVLNAVPLDKRIMSNSTLGSFRVLSATDLSGKAERASLALLVHKAGDLRGSPAVVSFDGACLTAVNASGVKDWTDVADAAIGSLSSLIVLEGQTGTSAHEWASLITARANRLGVAAPEVKVSRPMGPTETKREQWMRLRPSCLLHCCAEEADVAQLLRGGAAVLRRSGRAALPPLPESHSLPPVVVLDRCNGERLERSRWLTLGGLDRNQVIALHLDVPEAECIARVARKNSTGKHGQQSPPQATAEATALVRPHVERFEAPSEREGFRAIVRLKGGSAAAVQELVRRWTEGGPPPGSETADAVPPPPPPRGRRLEASEEDDENEAPPPPLPLLSQWIEVLETSDRRSVWSVPVGGPVDAPGYGSEEEEYDDDGGGGAGGGASGSSLPPDRPPFGTGPIDGDLPWQGLEGEARLGGGPGTVPARGPLQAALVHDEDAEESARQEQLAATLRCMGFDEEPALSAAQQAGGNLNVAIESVLRSSGAIG